MPHNRNDAISLDDGYQPSDYDPPSDDVATEYVDAVDAVDDRGHFDDDRGKPRVSRPKPLAPRSTVPPHAPRPQDHLKPRKAKKRKRRASDPAQREAAGIETETVEFDGESYTIAADPLDWSLPVTQAFEEGKVLTAIRGLLGPAQYRALLAKDYTNRQFSELFGLLAEAGGFETAGN
ncbi:hypothetical protein [Nocardia salmonicida]|uniref:hypothetical protein n=1 Tax=Nocardia salmonicida TaxID=53431 RepID=UPI002E2D74B8|nr:hypothetical protein [Nocardia salmonicida]